MADAYVELTTHHYALLVASALTNPSFAMETTRTAIEPAWFVNQLGGQMWHTIAYAAIKAFCDTHGKPPSVVEFVTEFNAFMDRYAGEARPLVQLEFSQFLALMYPMVARDPAHSLTLARSVRTEILRRCQLVPVASQMLQEAQSLAERGDVKAAMEISEQVKLNLQKHNQSAGPSAMRLGDIPEGFGDVGDGRIKLGVDFIDAKLGAGSGPFSPCTAVLLGPQGGGKTTAGNQICVGQALMGRRSLMVVAEQGADRMYRARLQSCATGIPTNAIAARNYDVLLAAGDQGLDVNMVRGVKEVVSNNLHVYDMVTDPTNTPDGIELMIRRMKESEGPPLEVVYIDWCGKVADRIMDIGFRGRTSFKEKRDAIQYFADAMAEVAAVHKVFIVLSHQLASAQTAMTATKEYSYSDAMDCKSITALAQYCFILSPKDPKTKVQIFSMPKCRYDAPVIGPDRVPVVLDGPTARFRSADGFLLSGNHIQKTHAKPNAVPKEG